VAEARTAERRPLSSGLIILVHLLPQFRRIGPDIQGQEPVRPFLVKRPKQFSFFGVEALAMQADYVVAFGVAKVCNFAPASAYQTGYGLILTINSSSTSSGTAGREADPYVLVLLCRGT
jgi:hypothetical protein